MAVTHQIDDLVLDLTFRSRGSARRTLDDIRYWLEHELLPELDAILTQYSPGHETLRIDTLHLDCGVLTRRNYKQVIQKQLFDELERVVPPQLLALGPQISFVLNSGAPPEDVALHQLIGFLQSGQLPWHRLHSNDELHDQLFERIAGQPHMMNLLQQAIGSGPALRRLVRQFPEQRLNEVLARLAPGLLPLAIAMQDLYDLGELARRIGRAARSALHEAQWTSLLGLGFARPAAAPDAATLAGLLRDWLAAAGNQSGELVATLVAPVTSAGWVTAGPAHGVLAEAVLRLADDARVDVASHVKASASQRAEADMPDLRATPATDSPLQHAPESVTRIESRGSSAGSEAPSRVRDAATDEEHDDILRAKAPPRADTPLDRRQDIAAGDARRWLSEALDRLDVRFLVLHWQTLRGSLRRDMLASEIADHMRDTDYRARFVARAPDFLLLDMLMPLQPAMANELAALRGSLAPALWRWMHMLSDRRAPSRPAPQRGAAGRGAATRAAKDERGVTAASSPGDAPPVPDRFRQELWSTLFSGNFAGAAEPLRFDAFVKLLVAAAAPALLADTAIFQLHWLATLAAHAHEPADAARAQRDSATGRAGAQSFDIAALLPTHTQRHASRRAQADAVKQSRRARSEILQALLGRESGLSTQDFTNAELAALAAELIEQHETRTAGARHATLAAAVLDRASNMTMPRPFLQRILQLLAAGDLSSVAEFVAAAEPQRDGLPAATHAVRNIEQQAQDRRQSAHRLADAGRTGDDRPLEARAPAVAEPAHRTTAPGDVAPRTSVTTDAEPISLIATTVRHDALQKIAAHLRAHPVAIDFVAADVDGWRRLLQQYLLTETGIDATVAEAIDAAVLAHANTAPSPLQQYRIALGNLLRGRSPLAGLAPVMPQSTGSESASGKSASAPSAPSTPPKESDTAQRDVHRMEPPIRSTSPVQAQTAADARPIMDGTQRARSDHDPATSDAQPAAGEQAIVQSSQHASSAQQPAHANIQSGANEQKSVEAAQRAISAQQLAKETRRSLLEHEGEHQRESEHGYGREREYERQPELEHERERGHEHEHAHEHEGTQSTQAEPAIHASSAQLDDTDDRTTDTARPGEVATSGIAPILLDALTADTLSDLCVALATGSADPFRVSGAEASWIALLQVYTGDVLGQDRSIGTELLAAIRQHALRAKDLQLYYQNVLACLIAQVPLDLEEVENAETQLYSQPDLPFDMARASRPAHAKPTPERAAGVQAGTTGSATREALAAGDVEAAGEATSPDSAIEAFDSVELHGADAKEAHDAVAKNEAVAADEVVVTNEVVTTNEASATNKTVATHESPAARGTAAKTPVNDRQGAVDSTAAIPAPERDDSPGTPVPNVVPEVQNIPGPAATIASIGEQETAGREAIASGIDQGVGYKLDTTISATERGADHKLDATSPETAHGADHNLDAPRSASGLGTEQSLDAMTSGAGREITGIPTAPHGGASKPAAAAAAPRNTGDDGGQETAAAMSQPHVRDEGAAPPSPSIESFTESSAESFTESSIERSMAPRPATSAIGERPGALQPDDTERDRNPWLVAATLLARDALSADEQRALADVLDAIPAETHALRLRGWMKLLADTRLHRGWMTYVPRARLVQLIRHAAAAFPDAQAQSLPKLDTLDAPLTVATELYSAFTVARRRAVMQPPATPAARQAEMMSPPLPEARAAHQAGTPQGSTQPAERGDRTQETDDAPTPDAPRTTPHLGTDIAAIETLHAAALSLAQLLAQPVLAADTQMQLKRITDDILQLRDATLLREWRKILSSARLQQGLARHVPGHVVQRLLQHLAPDTWTSFEAASRIVVQALGLLVPDARNHAIEQARWQFLLERAFATGAARADADLLVELSRVLAAAAGLPDDTRLLQLVERRRLALATQAQRTQANAAERADSLAFPGQSPASAASDEGITGEVHLDNVGLVLAAPYIPRLFSLLNVTVAGNFPDHAAAERGMHLLQFLVTGQSFTPEYKLLLNKVLCGIVPGFPVCAGIDISAREQEVIEQLLHSMIQHWKILGSTSIAGLRQTFLQRQGWLRQDDSGWHLEVKPGSFDMLLDQIPWNFSLIKFTWMDQPMHVTWRNKP